jgi:hypothetical protein
MQRLPNVDDAVIHESKMTTYLLAVEHPVGRANARLVHHFDFRLEAWEMLRTALLAHARNHAIASRAATPYGMKDVIEGPLVTPGGRNPLVRAVWFVASGQAHPRFVTAYPLEGGQA